MEKIENVSNPVIGEKYMVRCVLYNSAFDKEIKIWIPVFSHKHSDKGYQEALHYHLDNRFTEEYFMLRMREVMENGEDEFAKQNKGYGEWSLAVRDDLVEKEEYKKMIYLRHMSLPKDQLFHKIIDQMKGKTMKDMICPHHGASLKSCPVVDGVVTCPQHGMKWNVKTGKLVN